jgi:N-acetylneuraminic acid mutarotase
MFVVGCEGYGFQVLSSMERYIYDITSGQWVHVVAAAMSTARRVFGTCAVAGELYVTGGRDDRSNYTSPVEKYSPSSDTWSSVKPLATAHCYHAALAMGPATYGLGGMASSTVRLQVMCNSSTARRAHGARSDQCPRQDLHTLPACLLGSNIYVFGGYDNIHNQQDSVFMYMYMYDTFANMWTTLAPLPTLAFIPA